MRKVAWVVPMLVFAGIGSWWASAQHTPRGKSQVAKASEGPAAEGDLTARVAALEAANDHVRRDIALTRLTTASIAQKAAHAESAESSGDDTRNRGDTQTSPIGEGTSLADRQQAGMEIVEQELQATVDAEAADREWAATAEDAFRRSLSGLEGGLVLESARCGSSLCSVVVSHQDDGAHVGLVNALQGNTQEFAGQVLVRRHPNPAGGYTTSFYFTKPGEHIPELRAALAGEY
jgi:hypothetical protein